jgi:hypothetical protein
MLYRLVEQHAVTFTAETAAAERVSRTANDAPGYWHGTSLPKGADVAEPTRAHGKGCTRGIRTLCRSSTCKDNPRPGSPAARGQPHD